MKVILTKDIKGTGRMHSAVEVADGHAINFLIPRGMAVRATASGLKHAEARAGQIEERRMLDAKLISERLSALAEERIVITKKANEQEHLYDAVDAKEIAAATNLPEDAIRLAKPIKELGTHEVPVAFGEDFGKLTIVIEAE